MKKNLARMAGVLLGIALLWHFLSDLDLHAVSEHLRQAKWQWVLLGMLILTADIYPRALRWHFMLTRRVPTVPYRVVFRSYVMSYALNNVLPGRLGEAFRPLYVSRNSTISLGETAGSLVLERVLDVMALALSMGVFFLLGWRSGHTDLPLSEGQVKLVIAAGLGSSLAVVLSFFAGVFGSVLERWLVRILPPSQKGLRRKLLGFLISFLRGAATLGNWRNALWILFLTVLTWLGVAIGLWVVLLGFCPDLPMRSAFLLLPVASLGMALPTPGGMGGVHEATNLVLEGTYKVARDLAAGAAIILHLALVIPYILWGGIYFLLESKKALGEAEEDPSAEHNP